MQIGENLSWNIQKNNFSSHVLQISLNIGHFSLFFFNKNDREIEPVVLHTINPMNSTKWVTSFSWIFDFSLIDFSKKIFEFFFHKCLLLRVCQKSIFLSNQFSQVGYVWEYVSGCTTFFFRIFEQKLSQRQPLQDLITFNKYLVFSGQYSSQNSCLNHKILSAKSDCCTHRKQFFQHGTMVPWYYRTVLIVPWYYRTVPIVPS